MSIDAPDWIKIVKSVPFTGADVDAPDWVRQVAGPGGGPIGGGSLTYEDAQGSTEFSIVAGGNGILATTPSLTVGTWLLMGVGYWQELAEGNLAVGMNFVAGSALGSSVFSHLPTTTFQSQTDNFSSFFLSQELFDIWTITTAGTMEFKITNNSTVSIAAYAYQSQIAALKLA